MKVSKENHNVIAASAKDLSYTTEGISPKVKVKDYVNVTSTPTNVSHGLGYYPFFWVWKKRDSGRWSISNETVDWDVWVTTSNLVFNETGEFCYVIFYDELE